MEFDHSTQTYVPGLAEAWTTGADQRSIDIRLRDGLKFSDGQPLTSSDVAFTLEATYDERNRSEVFRDALLINGKPISVKVIDDRNFQLVLPETVAAPDNYLYNISVLPRNALEADQKAGRLSEAWKITAPPASVISSGPFVVSSAAAAERIVLKRNPHYWKRDAQGTQLPYLDELTLVVVPDANQTRRVGPGHDRYRGPYAPDGLRFAAECRRTRESLRSRSKSWGRLYLVQSESRQAGRHAAESNQARMVLGCEV